METTKKSYSRSVFMSCLLAREISSYKPAKVFLYALLVLWYTKYIGSVSRQNAQKDDIQELTDVLSNAFAQNEFFYLYLMGKSGFAYQNNHSHYTQLGISPIKS